ncbi:dihydroorotase [Thermodesulfobacteriota bacterium]
MQTLIRGGRVIDPGQFDDILDILIKDGKIAEITAGGNHPESGGSSNASGLSGPEMKIIDASGKIVTPGLIDMHVHLREPGYEYKETIETGCMAAVSGGFTAVCCMPNTNPVNDSREVTEFILKKAAEANTARVYPVVAISIGLNGEHLSEFGDLKEAGAIALSDDGNPVTDGQFMRKAMEYAKGFGLPVISHSEELSLAADGVMNEGAVATRMGLAGIPNAAESVMVMRDIALSELTDTPIHIAHVSTQESVRAIREAKKRGVSVTAETAPHYFTLIDEAVEAYNTNAKMNPPLRSSRDREAVRQGLADGTIDAIATDHAPHSVLEKEVEFDRAANGIIGLETAFPLALKLVSAGIISIGELVEKMSKNPARILGIQCGLRVGSPADLTIIDPEITHVVDTNRLRSLSKNTPFDGWEMKGRAICTMVGGKVAFQDTDFRS